MTQFTAHHLRFTVEAETTIELNAFKGSALRGAWQSHLRTLYCAQTTQADPLHQAMCPVCYLLSRDTGSGDDRRPYGLMPPLTEQRLFQPGQQLQFGFSLFGQAIQFLPYLVLAVGQMGQHQGLGKPIHAGGPGDRRARRQKGNGQIVNCRRGQFRLVEIEEINLITGQSHMLLSEGETMVKSPTLPIADTGIAEQSRRLATVLAKNGCRYGCRLSLTFLTPTRIIHDKRLVHQPQFKPLFARLIDRIDALRQQYADAPRLPKTERDHLLTLAEEVKLVDDQTHWWDVAGHSTRLKQKQRLGGFVGQAVYEVENSGIWESLLPWLIWGTVTQVGKHTVKGCGWYSIQGENNAHYHPFNR
jgi:hypothetical protein